MIDLVPVMPRQPAPALTVPLVGGGRYDLAAERPRLFSMIVFYRGLHCEQCRSYLTDLETLLPEFEKRGLTSVAISCDTSERAQTTKSEWGLTTLRLGYALDLAQARRWGLFLTRGRPREKGLSEPPFCCEPGLFLIGDDKTLFFSAVQNMAFARPRFADLIDGFEFLFARGYFIDKECPARGEILTLEETRAVAGGRDG